MAIPLTTLSSRKGVLAYPEEVAQVLADNPPGSTDPAITDEVLATRAGVLRFPNEAAEYIADLSTGLKLRFDNGISGPLSSDFTFTRNAVTIDGLAEEVDVNEPRYDISKALHQTVGNTRTLAYSDENIIQAFGGVDVDGSTPLMVTINNNNGQLLVFRKNLSSPVTVFTGRNGASFDINSGLEPAKRYIPVTGTICHGLIILECVRWNMDPSERESIAIFVSQDLGVTWQVVTDTLGNRTFPTFKLNHQRGAGFCLQNWYPEVEGSSLAVWFAFTDYLIRNGGPASADSTGGQTGLFRATRASVNDPWVVDNARLVFQYDDVTGLHFHSAYPIIDLEAGKIGVVTSVGDTTNRNFMCLSSMNINNPTDYKTAVITQNREFNGKQGVDPGTTYGLWGFQFTSCAPGPIRNSALVGSDFNEEVVAMILPPEGSENWATAKAKIKRVYGNDRDTENFSVICRDPLTRTGYVSARERVGGSLNEFFFSEDGEHWDDVYRQVSGADSPYPSFFGNKIVDNHTSGLYTIDIPQTVARRPLLVGPGHKNNVGAWSSWIGATPGTTRTKIDPNADGLYEYPAGHPQAGELLPEQPQTLTEVWRIQCTGESDNIGAFWLTPTGQPTITAGPGCVTYGVFDLLDAQCFLNDENSGYEVISPSTTQQWFYETFPNRTPPVTSNRATMMLLNRDGSNAKPLDILITVVSHHVNGNRFTMGYPVAPLDDKSAVHEVADISVTVGSTWNVKAELGLGLFQFPNPTATTPLLTIREDADNYITVFWSAADQLTLSVVADGGAAVTSTLSVASFRRFPDRNFKLLVSRLADGTTELMATSAGSAIVSTTVAAVIDGTALIVKLGSNVDNTVVSPLRVFGITLNNSVLAIQGQRNQFLSRID